MKAIAVRFVIAAAIAVPLGAQGDVALLTPSVIYALTPIDSLPSTAQLNAVHNGSEQEALANLQAIALAQTGVDLGVQLRAVRALTHYCPTPCASHEVHTTLTTIALTPRYRDSREGGDLLVLRAAIEALGVLRVPEDVATLVPQLEHPSRDIRATTARALRDLGNTQAIAPLRMRHQQEQVPQVRVAISDALRVLGQPVP